MIVFAYLFLPCFIFAFYLLSFHFSVYMDKLQLTGRALGRVFNFRSACMHTMHLLPSVAIQPDLELKTRPKQLLGSLLLVIVLLAIYLFVAPQPVCSSFLFSLLPQLVLSILSCFSYHHGQTLAYRTKPGPSFQL